MLAIHWFQQVSKGKLKNNRIGFVIERCLNAPTVSAV